MTSGCSWKCTSSHRHAHAGTICYENDHPDVIAAVASGKISGLDDFVSRRISLDDVVEKGFEALIKEKASLGKHVALLHWDRLKA